MAEFSDKARRKSKLRAAFAAGSLCLAAILLYFALRGIAWREVWLQLRRADTLLLAFVVIVVSFALLLRALRWRVLLTAESDVPIRTAFWATSAGYFGNNVLPARAGELIRTVIVSRASGLNTAFVLTTALSERVSDAVVLVAISATVLLSMAVRPGWLSQVAKPFAAIGLGGVALIALLPVTETLWVRMLHGLPLPETMRKRLEGILGQVLRALRSFHDVGRFARFAGLTAVIWCMDAAVAIGTAKAVGLSMSLPAAFLLLAGLGLGSALPSTPGYIGVYQFVAVSLLTPFGFSQNDAIAFILLLQAVIYVAVLSWGSLGLYFFRGQIRL